MNWRREAWRRRGAIASRRFVRAGEYYGRLRGSMAQRDPFVQYDPPVTHTVLIDLRTTELLRAREVFPPSGEVLEIGGGNGWQASRLASWGYRVHSIDVELQPELHFPVQLYDGVHLPHADQSIDLIFSSNVLEHVVQRPELFEEMRRVLKVDGRMVHVVPSASWRFWTSLAHYPYVLKRIVSLPFASRAAAA